VADLPISGDQYFADFAFDQRCYDVERNGKIVVALNGLPNEEDGETYIHFPLGSDITIGDVLHSDGESLTVTKIDTDCYNEEPELIKAYF